MGEKTIHKRTNSRECELENSLDCVLDELNPLHIAATRLYYARLAACDRPAGEAQLLENLRVALRLPEERGPRCTLGNNSRRGGGREVKMNCPNCGGHIRTCHCTWDEMGKAADIQREQEAIRRRKQSSVIEHDRQRQRRTAAEAVGGEG